MNNKLIHFRKATINDVNVLAQHRVLFLNEIMSPSEAHPLSNDLYTELSNYFSSALENDKIVVWLAESDREVIATSSMVFWHIPPSFSDLKSKGKRAYILNMYTMKEFRKQGIASKLLDYLIEEANSRGIYNLSLNATKDGNKLYRSKGFIGSIHPELKLDIH